jgi:NAD(P)-dependent dehydrogenase (short-subunit alcohol dehydrogenase family)
MHKWILVTGASRRIGAEIALTLAAHKHSVVAHYRSHRSEAESVAEHCRAQGVAAETIQGDFQTMEGVERFLADYLSRFQETYGIVNNVGNYPLLSATQTSPRLWAELYQTNLHAPFALIQGLLPSLKRNKGRIVNMGATGAKRLSANTSATAYRGTKQGLYFLTLSLAKELAADEVTVNMVSPGYTEVAVDLDDPKKLPMKRAATLKEVAEVVALCFQPEWSYITGQNIEVAGGVGL